jgi:hypothetical protein
MMIGGPPDVVSSPEVGRLEVVNVREIWHNEARDFTPWLLNNADYLAEVLGVDIEMERAEHPVGGFSLDLIGRDLTNDAVLIVENQLDSTDHSHLGQLVTYAAGTGASTIVWIATSFRDEHRQAVDWLNQSTREDVRIFGLELHAVRIGTSPAAPMLRVAAQPNDWQKQVRSASEASRVGPKGALYIQFWTRYLERMREEHPDWSRARKPPSDNWMAFPSPLSGTSLNTAFGRGQRLRHELYIDTGYKERNEEIYQNLLSQQQVLEAAYGGPLSWYEWPEYRACSVADYRDGDVTHTSLHDEYIDWFFDTGTRFRIALAALETSDI